MMPLQQQIAASVNLQLVYVTLLMNEQITWDEVPSVILPYVEEKYNSLVPKELHAKP